MNNLKDRKSKESKYKKEECRWDRKINKCLQNWQVKNHNYSKRRYINNKLNNKL